MNQFWFLHNRGAKTEAFEAIQGKQHYLTLSNNLQYLGQEKPHKET